MAIKLIREEKQYQSECVLLANTYRPDIRHYLVNKLTDEYIKDYFKFCKKHDKKVDNPQTLIWVILLFSSFTSLEDYDSNY